MAGAPRSSTPALRCERCCVACRWRCGRELRVELHATCIRSSNCDKFANWSPPPVVVVHLAEEFTRHKPCPCIVLCDCRHIHGSSMDPHAWSLLHATYLRDYVPKVSRRAQSLQDTRQSAFLHASWLLHTSLTPDEWRLKRNPRKKLSDSCTR